ncbi:GtrA family protein [Paenibacillus cisolokensis]|uniref:GtrA/DPMS transmembrane domain-containing protein n=1 Tax=Paenibacillus cisolokensis TaxID=1658519 RepID=A0ABQ4N5G3_9BACL|nr:MULTISPECIES: GtrA family protein [Paenibacillus]ALS30064.1 GtrA-like protein [Paenibacillus sp. 32O-W]GIQ63459.1 hypothetical protein PACILC2_20270 [Paenibacillus cisolokensis]
MSSDTENRQAAKGAVSDPPVTVAGPSASDPTKAGPSAANPPETGAAKSGTAGTMIRFGAVGVLNTAVDAVVFALLYAWGGAPYAAAQTAAYGAGMLNSYIWNKRWTFKSRKRGNAREWLSFLLVNGMSYGVSIAALSAAYELAGFSIGWSKALSVVSSLAVNYAGNRFWVFRPSSVVTMERRES